MSRLIPRRFLGLLSLVVVAGAAALAVVVALRGNGGVSPGASGEPPPAIEVRAGLLPNFVLFGDTLTARIEVTLDRSRVNPDSVQVRAHFEPWKQVAPPKRLRRDADAITYLQRIFVLRCLTVLCTPTRPTTPRDLAPVRVAYVESVAGHARRGVIRVQWPRLFVGSRFATAPEEGSVASVGPWQADLLSMPAVSYRIAPWLLLALLIGAGSLLTAGGVSLAYVARPRRAPPPPPPVEEPPEPVLTPLERALALLEDPTRVDGAAEQRRALELVADELAAHGDDALAQAARTLAWSEPMPHVEETAGLAASARSMLAEELSRDAE